ncbi:Aste57867_18872 [Aphanomyces stellatus]|uniref:Aste57867_18872 protein n=1 Tax=Aphanomyces stellatus TaxID=120398 RepID=A0A485LFG6_9STRA|nr:hypothetical protein As57867_018808 [Aphanomyces stellatus]VFT95606.1 Aste57867_18872 [Aphanomyces stellatus]
METKGTSETGSSKGNGAVDERKLGKRRHDCMLNQRRYRERKRGKALKLEEYVTELAQSSQMLEAHASMLRSTVLTQFAQAGAHRCHSIASYLHMFQHGLVAPHDAQFPSQMALVRGVMSDSLQFNGEVGPDALIRQWRSYSHSFQHLDMRSGTIQSCGSEHDVVIANSKLLLVFSRRTLGTLFPHVLAREDLVQRLVDREIEFELRLSFSFDDSRVAVMEANVQMVDGLVRALESADDALFLMQGVDTGESVYFTPNGLLIPPSDTTALVHPTHEARPPRNAESPSPSSSSSSASTTSPEGKRRIEFILG